MRISMLSVGLCTSLAGCGSATISEPGRGSSTLDVGAHITVVNQVPNAASADQFATALSARLTKAGAPLHGAAVTIASSKGDVVLVEQDPTGNHADYAGEQAGYAQAYTLTARLGDDYIEGVSLSGPDVHSFSVPALAAQVAYGQPLVVEWSPSGATLATLETRELNPLDVPDTGSYSVPGSGLRKPDPGKTQDERVRVTRSSTVNIAGGTAGSDLTVTVRNEVTFLVVN